MNGFKSVFVVVIFVLGHFYLSGQERDPLVTDRPDMTESAVSVAPGIWQIESGFHFEVDEMNGEKNFSRNLNSTLIRYGIVPGLELRLGVGYSSFSEPGSTVEGFEPLSFGFKAELFSQSGARPKTAILNVVVPGSTGSSHFRSDSWSGTVLSAMSWELGEGLGLGANLGVAFEGQGAGALFPYSSSLGVSLGENLGGFVELFGLLSEDSGPAHSGKIGLVYLLTPDFQVDAYVSKGLNDRAPDWFAGFGVSWRFEL